MKIKLNTLIFDLPGTSYHAVPGTFSSSQLKDMLEDENLFFKKYIEKSVKRETNSAFDVGTYFHTGVLEPEKLADECAVFAGAIRRGKDYDAFCEAHAGKVIVTSREKDIAEGLISSVNDSPVATSILRTCQSEVSLFVRLQISADWGIHAKKDGGYVRLSDKGWQPIGKTLLDGNWQSMLIKVRADAIDKKGRYIIDLKSTTGNAKNDRTVRTKISAFKYDLSAALYLDIFSLAFDKPVENFFWTFASKDYFNSRTWVASEDNIRIGRAKWSMAVMKLAGCMRENWKTADTLGVAEPEFYERDWLTSVNSKFNQLISE